MPEEEEAFEPEIRARNLENKEKISGKLMEFDLKKHCYLYIFWNNYPSSVILSQIHSLSLNDNGLSIEVQKDSDTSLWSSDDRALGVVSSEGHSSPSYPHSGGGQFGSRLLVKGKISPIRMDSESIDISKGLSGPRSSIGILVAVLLVRTHFFFL